MKKRARILMINPKASPKMPYDGPPLSILNAVALLAGTGRDITVLDWHYTNFEERIADHAARSDICGITCMTGYQIGTMLNAARIARESNPSLVIVCGGCHPTLLPEQTLRHPLVDIVVIGQGQRTFSELVSALEEERDLEDVSGIGFKRNGQIIITRPRRREDINKFPPPPYHLIPDYERFITTGGLGKRTFYYLSSEGCTGKCKFCAEESLYHRRWNALSVQRVINDIVAARAVYEFDSVAIADSNFYVSEKRVIEFCNAFKHLGLKWGGTSARPDQLSRFQDATFALMKESGLQDIFLGVESGDDEKLAMMDKGCFVKQTLDLLPRLHRYGIRIQCSFIIGIPGCDVRKDFEETVRFINRLRRTGYVSQFHLFIYTPLPGTRFLAEAIREGYKVPERLEDWVRYEFHAHTTPWVPRKYAVYTDAASVYFMFLAGHARTVIKTLIPKPLLPLALLVERLFYLVSLIRVSTAFFVGPIDYYIIKWILLRKDRLFPNKRISF